MFFDVSAATATAGVVRLLKSCLEKVEWLEDDGRSEAACKTSHEMSVCLFQHG